MKMGNLEGIIKECARKVGFTLTGITTAEPLMEESSRLKRWLEMGFQADMAYMERNLEKRINPALHLRDARSVVVFGTNYFHRLPPDSGLLSGISMYARGRDYHIVLREMTESFIAHVKEKTGLQFNAKIFVDSSPLLERALARRAGLGWWGKNSCIINRESGSYFFISGIVIDIELEPDSPFNQNLCGRCTECMDACPTGAIVTPHVVDSRLCISYHTIENKGEIPEFVRKRMNGWLFGCDICQQVCPWNRKAVVSSQRNFLPDERIRGLSLEMILSLNEERFHEIFSKTPVKRAGLNGLLRNALIVAGNSGNRRLLKEMRKFADSKNELLREHALWGEKRLSASFG